MKRLIPTAILGAITALGMATMYKYDRYESKLTDPVYKEEFLRQTSNLSKRMHNRKFPAGQKPSLTIDMTLYVDLEFKYRYDSWIMETRDRWEKEIEDSMETASERIYKEFDVGFEVKEVKYWDPKLPNSGLEMILTFTDTEDDTLGSFGFTGKEVDCSGYAVAKALGYTINLYAFAREQNPYQRQYITPLENVVQHELSHWLGAKDIFPPEKGCLFAMREPSIMDYCSLDATNWSEESKKQMQEGKNTLIRRIDIQKGLKTGRIYIIPWHHP